MTRQTRSFNRVRSFVTRHRLVPAVVAALILLAVWVALSLSLAQAGRAGPLTQPATDVQPGHAIAGTTHR